MLCVVNHAFDVTQLCIISHAFDVTWLCIVKHTFDVTWFCMVSHVFEVTWLCVVDCAFDVTWHLVVCREGGRKSLAFPCFPRWEEAAAAAELHPSHSNFLIFRWSSNL